MRRPRVRVPYAVLRFILHLLRVVILRRALHVTGLEHVPASGPVIVVGNHIATVDPPLTGALIRRLDVHYMAKSESFRNPWTRWLFHGYNAFPVVRHTADRGALKYALRLLKDGHVLVLYPEGTRSPDRTVHRPFAGAGFLARHSGVPIVPAAIWGSEDVLPKGASWPRHADVNIIYGEPFHLPDRNPDGTPMTHQESADYMMSRVAALLPLRYRGVFAGPAVTAPPPAA